MENLIVQADAAFSKIYKDYRKLVKSLMVGVLATLVDMAVLYLLKNDIGIFYLYSSIISYLTGMMVSFYLNKTFTFKNTYEKFHYQFASFAVVAFTQLILTTAMMYVLVDLIFNNDANAYVMGSKIIVAFLGFIYAFTLNKSLTFKIFK